MKLPEQIADLANYWHLLTQSEQERTLAILREMTAWPDGWPRVYVNSETGKAYKPHHEAEREFLENDGPRYALARGGEGGGKSVLGIIKTLERLRRGMSGIMVSPDLPHFKKSLWPEFRRWCPWGRVVEGQRYRGAFTWECQSSFTLAFENGATLLCGGMDDPTGWEGPNIDFAHCDEFRRLKTPNALKVLDGRVRIPGPNNEPPQIWITTTPAKNWLFDYFGPLQDKDLHANFKRDSRDIILLTKDNEANLVADFVVKRSQTLTSAEIRVLLEAQWEEIDTGQRFLPNILLWDACKEDLPDLSIHEPMVIALDASVTGDCFAMVGVTRHPQRLDDVAARFVQVWDPRGKPLDYQGTEDDPGPELILRRICEQYNVLMVTYDPFQLHDFATRLGREGITWFYQFDQGGRRLEADRQLLDLIQQRKLAHSGIAVLREHIDNADRKLDIDEHKLRIVKRFEHVPIDAAVCLSMAVYECLRLRL